jgi:glucosylglycerate synthase
MAVAESELLTPNLKGEVAALAPRELAVAIMTFENAATVGTVATAMREGLEKHFQGVPAVVVNVDAGSSDATAQRLGESGLPVVSLRHEAPVSERAAVPFHGVPGRNAAFRLAFRAARETGARVLLLLEPDVTSVSDDWIERLARPVLEGQADLVLGGHARRRYDGTITNLLLAPLTRALVGRRVHQPLVGAAALSARALERVLAAPRWPAPRESIDLWLIGTAAAEEFGITEVWLGPRRVESATRASDLPSLLAQAVGGVFALMESAPSLWLDVRGSEPVAAAGDPPEPLDGGPVVEIGRLLEAFQRGVRDLMPIWESVLAPETLGDVLGLDASDALTFRFPDDVWARVIYDAALGHHYGVIHREHLLKALVPLYLGRTAAFILSTRARSAAVDGALLERVGATFEAHKPYLTDRWR